MMPAKERNFRFLKIISVRMAHKPRAKLKLIDIFNFSLILREITLLLKIRCFFCVLIFFTIKIIYTHNSTQNTVTAAKAAIRAIFFVVSLWKCLLVTSQNTIRSLAKRSSRL